MKKLVLIMLFPSLIFGQVQIGQNINGEAQQDGFGQIVSISSNGDIVAIGSLANDGNGEDSGHVRVYRNEENVWVQIGDDIDGEASFDYAGVVSLSGDGSIVAIRAYGNDENGFNSGHVRVYRNEEDVWVQVGEDIDGEGVNDGTGRVVISEDGKTVAISAFQNDGNGEDSGHVRVYRNEEDVWVQVGGDIDGDAPGDTLGYISLSNDGSILATGATNGIINKGYVRVHRNEEDVWVQIGEDIIGDDFGDYFGVVNLSGDGNVLGTWASGSNNDEGQTKVYRNIEDAWVQIGEDINGNSQNDFFGNTSLSDDGSTIAIGTPRYSSNRGQVRIYRNIEEVWVKIGENIEGETSGDYFGPLSISADGSTLVVGAWRNSENGTGAGQARVFDLSNALSNDTSVLNKDVVIFPVPSNNTLFIKTNEGSILKKVVIFNALGQEVQTGNSDIVDLSKLSPGNYYVRVITNNGEIIKKAIVE